MEVVDDEEMADARARDNAGGRPPPPVGGGVGPQLESLSRRLGRGGSVPSSLGAVVASAGSWLAASLGGATMAQQQDKEGEEEEEEGGEAAAEGGLVVGDWAAGLMGRLLLSVVGTGGPAGRSSGDNHWSQQHQKRSVADARVLQLLCTQQQFGLGRLLRHRFHRFACSDPALLHDLRLLQCAMRLLTRPAGLLLS